MRQYISKSTLVAVIEKQYKESIKRTKILGTNYWWGKADAYRNVLEILNDTIEVKKVNLEMEQMLPAKNETQNNNGYLSF